MPGFRRSPLCGTTLSLLLVACSADDHDADTDDAAPPELPFEYTTEHLVIHSDVERCAGDFARWDGFVEFAAGYLDINVPEPLLLYVWEAESFDGEKICGDWVGGCFQASSGIAYASWYSVEHELVHSLARGYTTRDSFFVEGIAEALSVINGFGYAGPTFPVQGSSKVDYASAGHFVRWLLETRGPELLIAHMSENGGVAQFEQIYASDLVEMTEAYYADASWIYPRMYAYPLTSFELEAEGVWSSDLDFSCARDDVRGTVAGRVAVRELTIPETGYYAFWTSAGGPIHATRTVYPQDEADFTQLFGHQFSLPPGQIAVAPISAGTYEIGTVAAPGVEAAVVKVWKSETSIPVPPEPWP